MRLRLWNGYPIIKPVMRWDYDAKIFRLVRVFHNTPKGRPYSWKFSFALTPCLFRYKREYAGFILIIFGIRYHHEHCYGGNYC
jgi:hypothetical protein